MKFLILLIIVVPCALVYILDAKGLFEETIKPSDKPKALKSQGLLMAALGFISIF